MSKNKVLYSAVLSFVILSISGMLLAGELTTKKSSRRTHKESSVFDCKPKAGGSAIAFTASGSWCHPVEN